ncbi:MAG: ABC transporter permease [Spirochaetes bacterium]|nr:ABC transporter permease [Spirochaetota bacterium]MBU1079511.1 ABC transporter permease [Spirochaetota bacterium]
MKDFTYRLGEFWADFRKETSGLIGLGILALCVVVVLLEPVFLPYKDIDGNWRDITYWEDNPPAAPPAWTNLFAKEKSATTIRFESPSVSDEEDPEYGPVRVFTFKYPYKFDKSPLDIIMRAKGTGMLFMNISMERPDGNSVFLGQVYQDGLVGDQIRFAVDTDARGSVYEFIRDHASEEAISQSDSSNVKPTEIIFAQTGEKMLSERIPLKGDYLYKIKIPASLFEDGSNSIEDVRLVVTGRVSGVLGTDTSKRDIYSGIIAGLKWALFIGLITSIISVLVGVMYGIICAYFGGATDTIMSFIFEVFVSMPMLPILIVLSAIFKPSIWIIIGSMIAFYWVGPVKTVRSMALQIKEETYIEAAKALGSSKWRIIFKHMAPLLLPYSFANMALSVPGAIVAESSLSLLGLGDPTIISWGQILHDAQLSGATLNGLWWWIVPPGLFIAVMGMTFAFLGFAMDKILHPKLRTR